MAEKDVQLSRRYEAHGKTFDSVTLREPTLEDLFAVGDPFGYYPGPDGQGRFFLEHLDRYAAYLDRLPVPGKPGRECLSGLDLVDSMMLRGAIADFFLQALRRASQQTSSAGAPESRSETSSG